MYLLNLTQAKLEELIPYLDTVIVPVSAIAVNAKGTPDTSDSLFIRSAAQRLEDQLSGRILILPETVHTGNKAMNETDIAGEVAAASGPEAARSVLADFLQETVTPYKDMEFARLVFLYAQGTPRELMDEVVRKTEANGLQSTAFQLNELLDIDSFVVPGIIQMWRQEESNA